MEGSKRIMKEEKMDEKDTVQTVRAHMLPDMYVEEMTAFFKMFGDENRVRILYALSLNEMCVGDLVEVLGMSQSSVSHQLKLLRLYGQVKSRREGRKIYYSLDDQHVVDIFEQSLKHIIHRHQDHA